MISPFRLLSLGAALWWAGANGLAAADGSDAPTFPGAPATGLFDDPVLARGKDVEIRRSQLDAAFIEFKATMTLRGQALPENERRFQEAMVLQDLIHRRLLNLRATAEDRDKAKVVADRFLEEARNGSGSDEAFERRLRASGQTLAQYQQWVLEQAVAETVIEREVKSKLTVTDAQVKEFYESGTDALARIIEAEVRKLESSPETTLGQLAQAKQQLDKVRQENLARLEVPERVRILHIFMPTKDRRGETDLPEAQVRLKRQKMERLLARARGGEDFAKLVLENSEEQMLQQTRGEYVLTRNAPFSVEFKAAAFSLQTNQISDVVATPMGLHIIKLLERVPAQKTALADATNDIRQSLLYQELRKALPDYFAQLRKESDVQILDSRYVLDRTAEARSDALN